MPRNQNPNWMTEAEAKEKWCFREPRTASPHRSGPFCIASKCMAWQFKRQNPELSNCGLRREPNN